MLVGKKTFTVHETHSPTLKLLHIRTSLCVWEGLCSVITQKRTQHTIYTASLLNNIVYHSISIFNTRVSDCSFGCWYRLDDKSYRDESNRTTSSFWYFLKNCTEFCHTCLSGVFLPWSDWICVIWFSNSLRYLEMLLKTQHTYFNSLKQEGTSVIFRQKTAISCSR